MFTLLAIRHGETLHNKESVIQGQLDIALSPTGRQQAIHLGNVFSQYDISQLWSSDLQRALHTTQIALEASSKDYSIQRSALLRERHYGEAQGQPLADLRKIAAEAGKTLPQFTPSGAETPQQFRSRVTTFFQELCDHCNSFRKSENGLEKFSDPTGPNSSLIVAIVCHGGWLRDFFTYLVEDLHCVIPGGLSEVSRITPNTAVSKFCISLNGTGKPSVVICEALHDTAHLSQDLFRASVAL